MPNLDDLDAPSRKRPRVRADDLVSVVNAVAKGMPCESAVNILCGLGMEEGAARKMVDPARAAYETDAKPAPAAPPVVNVTIPENAIKVNVERPAPANVTVKPADVVVQAAAPAAAPRPMSAVVKIHRNTMGRIDHATIESSE